MPILTATFDPAYAAVILTVDGALWPSTVDHLTITRQVTGEADIAVRGVEAIYAVGGTFVGSDPEAPLGESVTYRVDGFLAAVPVASASVTVDTSGSAPGIWVKVPGRPDLAASAVLRSISDVDSPTVGGVYQIVGGGAVSQTTATWSGVESDQATVHLSVEAGSGVTRLRAALAAGRVLLLQPVGSTDLDPGWYYVSRSTRSNPADMEAYTRRWFALQVQRVGIPAGDGQGIPGWTCLIVLNYYATCADLLAAQSTCFDLLQGA